MNLQLIFVGAFIALIVGVLKDGNIYRLRDELEFCVLIIPIIFALFVWRHSDHDANIIYKAAYIYSVIRPNVSNLTGDTDLLGFEKFLHRCRSITMTRFGIFVTFGKEHIFHLFFTGLSVLMAFVVFFKPGEFVFARNWRDFWFYLTQDVLLILDVFAFIGAVHVRKKIEDGYKRIIAKQFNL